MNGGPVHALRQATQQPHLIMWLCFGVVIAAAWGYVAVVSPSGVRLGAAGDLLRALCLADGDPWSRQSLIAAALMWTAMVLAMMLPSAAPMLATYMDIADAAQEKAMHVPSPFLLAAGYISVWLGFSLAMIVLQAVLQEQGLLGADEALTHPLAAAAVLGLAGAFQFTAFKHSCLRKCAHPMPWFLANWRDTPSGVFAMGFRQGLHCLGCCWALMLVMFAAGLMNLFWMAAIGLVMIAEKTIANPKPVSYGSGAVLLAAALGLAGYALLN